MATKTTLRAEIRARRRVRRTAGASLPTPSLPKTDQAPIFVHHRAEAAGIASQLLALASSMSPLHLPALFVPTPLEPDLSLALGVFPRALLPILVDEAGAPLGEPRWGLWEAGQALVTPGRPPAQPSGPALGADTLKKADLILVPALAASPTGPASARAAGGTTVPSPTARLRRRWSPSSLTTRCSRQERSPVRSTTCRSTQS